MSTVSVLGTIIITTIIVFQTEFGCVFLTRITEAFVVADTHLTFKGKVNQDVKMSEAIDDMVAYTKLTGEC